MMGARRNTRSSRPPADSAAPGDGEAQTEIDEDQLKKQLTSILSKMKDHKATLTSALQDAGWSQDQVIDLSGDIDSEGGSEGNSRTDNSLTRNSRSTASREEKRIIFIQGGRIKSNVVVDCALEELQEMVETKMKESGKKEAATSNGGAASSNGGAATVGEAVAIGPRKRKQTESFTCGFNLVTANPAVKRKKKKTGEQKKKGQPQKQKKGQQQKHEESQEEETLLQYSGGLAKPDCNSSCATVKRLAGVGHVTPSTDEPYLLSTSSIPPPSGTRGTDLLVNAASNILDQSTSLAMPPHGYIPPDQNSKAPPYQDLREGKAKGFLSICIWPKGQPEPGSITAREPIEQAMEDQRLFRPHFASLGRKLRIHQHRGIFGEEQPQSFASARAVVATLGYESLMDVVQETVGEDSAMQGSMYAHFGGSPLEFVPPGSRGGEGCTGTWWRVLCGRECTLTAQLIKLTAELDYDKIVGHLAPRHDGSTWLHQYPHQHEQSDEEKRARSMLEGLQCLPEGVRCEVRTGETLFVPYGWVPVFTVRPGTVLLGASHVSSGGSKPMSWSQLSKPHLFKGVNAMDVERSDASRYPGIGSKIEGLSENENEADARLNAFNARLNAFNLLEELFRLERKVVPPPTSTSTSAPEGGASGEGADRAEYQELMRVITNDTNGFGGTERRNLAMKVVQDLRNGGEVQDGLYGSNEDMMELSESFASMASQSTSAGMWVRRTFIPLKLKECVNVFGEKYKNWKDIKDMWDTLESSFSTTKSESGEVDGCTFAEDTDSDLMAKVFKYFLGHQKDNINRILQDEDMLKASFSAWMARGVKRRKWYLVEAEKIGLDQRGDYNSGVLIVVVYEAAVKANVEELMMSICVEEGHRIPWDLVSGQGVSLVERPLHFGLQEATALFRPDVNDTGRASSKRAKYISQAELMLNQVKIMDLLYRCLKPSGLCLALNMEVVIKILGSATSFWNHSLPFIDKMLLSTPSPAAYLEPDYPCCSRCREVVNVQDPELSFCLSHQNLLCGSCTKKTNPMPIDEDTTWFLPDFNLGTQLVRSHNSSFSHVLCVPCYFGCRVARQLNASLFKLDPDGNAVEQDHTPCTQLIKIRHLDSKLSYNCIECYKRLTDGFVGCVEDKGCVTGARVCLGCADKDFICPVCMVCKSAFEKQQDQEVRGKKLLPAPSKGYSRVNSGCVEADDFSKRLVIAGGNNSLSLGQDILFLNDVEPYLEKGMVKKCNKQTCSVEAWNCFVEAVVGMCKKAVHEFVAWEYHSLQERIWEAVVPKELEDQVVDIKKELSPPKENGYDWSAYFQLRLYCDMRSMDVSQISLLNAFCQGVTGTRMAVLSGFGKITAHITSQDGGDLLESVFSQEKTVNITSGDIPELRTVDVAHFVETPLGQDDLDHVLSMIANGSKLQWVVFAFRGSWWRDYLKEKGLANFDSVNINFHSEFGQVAFVTVNIDEELRNRLLQSRTSQGNKREGEEVRGGEAADLLAKRPKV